MTARIGATVPGRMLQIAATMSGCQGASQSGLLRVALALFQGKSPAEAVKYAGSTTGGYKTGVITAKVPEELVPEQDKSWAIRVGLGMAAGLDRETAEEWARLPQGRPRKSVTT